MVRNLGSSSICRGGDREEVYSRSSVSTGDVMKSNGSCAGNAKLKSNEIGSPDSCSLYEKYELSCPHRPWR